MPKYVPTVTPEEAGAVARLWDPGARDVTHVRSGENSVWGFEGRGGHILRVTSEVHRTRDGAIGLFDFDDCCHHWFCWDIVCALWRFRNAAPDDRAAFLGWFLDGYGAIREPDTALLQRFSDLVRLRTVGLLLYRARVQEAPATDAWTQRTRSWLDSAWTW